MNPQTRSSFRVVMPIVLFVVFVNFLTMPAVGILRGRNLGTHRGSDADQYRKMGRAI